MKKDEVIMASVFGGIGFVFAVISFLVESTVAKWVCGIVAILVIGFTLYATIESIVKSKRKAKIISDLFMQSMKDVIDKPDFLEQMNEAGNRRDLLFDRQRTTDSDYGYSASNPVMTSTVSKSDEYLSNLRTIDGRKFTWRRTLAISMREVHEVKNVMVDEYQLYLDGEEYKKVYICPYGHSSSYVPQGLTIIND